MVFISPSTSTGHNPAGVGQGLSSQRGGAQQGLTPPQHHSASSDAEPTLVPLGDAGDNPDHHDGLVLGSN